jgi:hypothetical protein
MHANLRGAAVTRDGTFGTIAAAAALAGMFGTSLVTAKVKLQAGRYNVTITYEVQEQRQNEARITTRCITAEDLSDPERVFNDQGNREGCTVRNLMSGNRKIRYDAECPNRTVHVEGELSGQSFSVVRIVKPNGNQGVSLKLAERGTRTGDCSASGGG